MRRQFGSAIADKIVDEQISADEMSTINKNMQELTALQERIDNAIAALPEGSDKQRLENQKAEARGFFNQYVLPAYMNLYNVAVSVKSGSEGILDSISSWWSGLFSGGDFGYGQQVRFGMGALVIPALPLGWVVAVGIIGLAGSASYYISQQMQRELAILNDPAFTAEQKKALIEGGSLYGILGQAKWLVIAAGVAGIGYLYFKNKDKS